MVEKLKLGNRPQPYYTDGMWNIIFEWDAASDLPIRCAVEIGSFRGEWASKVLGRFPISRLFAVDPWRSKRSGEQRIWDDHLESWIKLLGSLAWERAFPLRGTSEEWARVFPYEIDLLYIDGKHSYLNVLCDLRWWYPKLRRGGLVIGHDYNLHSVNSACLEFFREDCQVVDTGPMKPNRESGGKAVMTQSFWKIK